MTKLFFILLLLGHISFGQTTIKGITTISTDGISGDSLNKSPNLIFNDRIKLVQIDKSSAKVDIRLYRLHSLSNTKTLRRLFMVDTTWNAVEYDEWNKPIKIKKHNLIANQSFDSLFLNLLSYGILTLPSQSELEHKMYKEELVEEDGQIVTAKRKLHVLDGKGYIIEIKVGDKFRVYQFDNPDQYSNFYDNVSEFKGYLHIVRAFDTMLRRK